MLTPHESREGGFTLLELIIAMLLLTVVILGSAYTSSSLSRNAAESELEAMALQAVESRLSRIQIDSRYSQLESLYEGTETSVPGVPGITRTTVIERVQTAVSGGTNHDYTRIIVRASGAFLGSPIAREVIVAAP